MSDLSGQIVLAIDFGTSNSLMAAGTPEKVLPALAIDETAPDPTVLRSVLFTPESGQWYYGNAAINQYQQHFAEGRLFRSVKKYLPDETFKGTNINNRFVSLEELISVFLRHLRGLANEHFKRDVTAVVLGRPALFSSNAKDDKLAESRLGAAARLAGFKDVDFLAEPVAAAFEFRHQMRKKQNVLIADFGGGTSDFTVLRMGKEELSSDDVLAIGGVSLAGDAFDGTIMRHMIAPHFGSNVEYKMPMGRNTLGLPLNLLNKMCSPADMSMLAKRDIMTLLRDVQRWNITPEDGIRMQRLFLLIEEHLGYALFRSIEASKIDMSQNETAAFSFDYPGIEIHEQVSAKKFEHHSQSLVQRIVASMDETVQRSGLGYGEIDVVCCTGGTARIPALREALEQRLGKEKLQQHRHFHSVVGGLAERAHVLARG